MDTSTTDAYRVVESAVRSLPDGCASDVAELADRIGIDKLALIAWVRSDWKLARLVASKVSS